MFIRDPFNNNVQILKNDEYLNYSNCDRTLGNERFIVPDFLPGMGPGPVQPPKPTKPVNPNNGPGPVMPPANGPGQPGKPKQGPGTQPPGPPVPPKPQVPPQPPAPTKPPGPPKPPAPPKPQGPNNPPGPPKPQGPNTPPPPQVSPYGPPPKFTPPMPPVSPMMINNSNLRRCVYNYIYIWLMYGNSFWFWPISIDRRTMTGYRWNGRRWIFDNINLSRIFAYKCFGRMADKKEDNVISYLKTQNISPQRINLEYPYISGSNNEDVEDIINEELINEYNNLLLKEVIVPTAANFATITSAYEVPLDSKGILSLVMSLYTKITGEDRGRTDFSSITLDINDGKVYSFDDLFNEDLDYRKKLSDIAVDKAKKLKIDFIAPYTGITDNQKYYLTPEELVLYYQVDEFTTYKEGLFRIPIEFTEIEDLLANDSPIKRLL